MQKGQIILLVCGGIGLVILVVFLIWRNQRDRKQINPDGQDAVEELHMEQTRRKDKM